jgi:hypothetical protein
MATTRRSPPVVDCLHASAFGSRDPPRISSGCLRRSWLLVGSRVYMLSPLPWRSGWAYSFAHATQPYQPSPKGLSGRPAHRPFRGLLGVHSRYGLHTRAVTVYRDTLTEGFSHFVTSIAAPVASGWSGCRVGFAPTGKVPPFHGAHPNRTFVPHLNEIFCCAAQRPENPEKAISESSLASGNAVNRSEFLLVSRQDRRASRLDRVIVLRRCRSR